MTTSDFKRYLSEQTHLAPDTVLIVNNLLDMMIKWVPENELPEALADILESTGISQDVIQSVTQYSHNTPTPEQHKLIFGITEIYEKFFDNYFRKGRSLWLDGGKLNVAFKRCEDAEFWERLNQELVRNELPELDMKVPPKFKTVQFYEDNAFKDWYHQSSITLINWLDEVTTTFCRFIVDCALQEE